MFVLLDGGVRSDVGIPEIIRRRNKEVLMIGEVHEIFG